MDSMLFPIFLDLRAKPCLFIWGEEGESRRKLKAMVQAGAQVLVIASEAMPAEFLTLVNKGQVQWSHPPVLEAYIDTAWLVVSASTCASLNDWLKQETLKRAIFLNVVDQRAYCTAIWPATIDREVVQVAISTSGTSPALAGYVRRRVAAILPVHIGSFARWLSAWRGKVAAQIPHLADRGLFWSTLLDGGLMDQYAEGGVPAADAIVKQALEQIQPDCGENRCLLQQK